MFEQSQSSRLMEIITLIYVTWQTYRKFSLIIA